MFMNMSTDISATVQATELFISPPPHLLPVHPPLPPSPHVLAFFCAQGPFPAKSMLEWHEAGYLHDMDLPVCGTASVKGGPGGGGGGGGGAACTYIGLPVGAARQVL